ncbi:hypothetical protein OJ997_15145 [Solirubrobacter phytolaccae]|uniref:Uncharacterized protein n=1 Tax=Solirubrobacter phytolaccae TaxID=1404360 RepID=A0A9X3SBP0_9ACTN|nr:hypothetical protein [Solirubrobacter phytolaccae]MDA0181640.1 hypothetical protein [Solirubrobacter phytolaccae]
MTLIPELERELERVMPVRRARKTFHVGVGIGVALLCGGTAALAATGVLQVPIGSPADKEVELEPSVGVGALEPGGVRVLAVQAEDPDGGPPWGLRMARTTRKLGCVQAARMQDGKLGVLGRDDAFGNDGKFHPIPDSNVGHLGACTQLDAKGQLVTSVRVGGIAASASVMGGCHLPQTTTGVPKDELCDPRSARTLYFGVLGPQAKSIVAYGKEIPTTGEEGAYLIVDRMADRGIGVGSGMGASPFPTNSPINEIRFKDGSSCAVTERGADESCVNPGYAAPPAPTLTEADVKSAIHVRKTKGKKGDRWKVRVSFRAPVAVPDASSAYSIDLSVPPNKQRHTGVSTSTFKNIKAGETVTFTFNSLGGHGRYHGAVKYGRVNGMFGMPGRDGLEVGKVSFRLP